MRYARNFLFLVALLIALFLLLHQQNLLSVHAERTSVMAVHRAVSGCLSSVPVKTNVVQGKSMAGNSQAQSSRSISPGMIDGAQHPELIPDSVAYRLFFLTVAEPFDATNEQKARQRAYLKMAGISDSELEQAATILATFKAQRDNLVSAYNNAVRAANNGSGEAPDLQSFMSQQQELVESTREALKASLSPTSMASLTARVQHEKMNMKVAKGDR